MASSATTPGGAMVAVFSDSPAGRRFLLLHNSEFPVGEAGDWAWGFPSGCREPGECIDATAARELDEETGISGDLTPVRTHDVAWAIYYLQVPWGTSINLAPGEHNAYEWVDRDDALSRLKPEMLGDSFQLVLKSIG
ncbi:NUDIX domain-containing protein [Ruania halotolerans]|uniref:NUDIX domain-containing protein n=1 Tax=Ruania halotolerans TaxID=2897773 RepID=UPI001E2F0356|nr:NUDIX domain-containing protein [Ruania halotolerans]UFU08248.1 NUDIX domain-containing protein [Ruania halotolerans]